MKVSDIIIWERNFWYKIENNGKQKSFTAWGIEKQNSNLFSGHQLAQIFLMAMKYESYIDKNSNFRITKLNLNKKYISFILVLDLSFG